MKQSRGFSLIELMIVIGIIGILTVMALPSYQEYTQRARFIEVIAISASYKTAIALALQQGIPASKLSLGSSYLPPPPKENKHLTSFNISQAVIHAKSSDIAGNSTLTLTPSADGSQWTVSGSCLKKRLCNA